jgi:hypothetical protein
MTRWAAAGPPATIAAKSDAAATHFTIALVDMVCPWRALGAATDTVENKG